jgi:hypothetical protein
MARLGLGQTIEIGALSWLEPGSAYPHIEIGFGKSILTCPLKYTHEGLHAYETHCYLHKHSHACEGCC